MKGKDMERALFFLSFPPPNLEIKSDFNFFSHPPPLLSSECPLINFMNSSSPLVFKNKCESEMSTNMIDLISLVP